MEAPGASEQVMIMIAEKLTGKAFTFWYARLELEIFTGKSITSLVVHGTIGQ